MTEMVRGRARLGLWSKIKLPRMLLNSSRSLADLLKTYDTATGSRHSGDDIDCVEKIGSTAVKNPDRSFNLLIHARMGEWPGKLNGAAKPDQFEAVTANQEDDLSEIEIVVE